MPRAAVGHSSRDDECAAFDLAGILEQHGAYRPAALEADHVAGKNHLCPESGNLGDGPSREVGATQPLREAEVVLDRRAPPRLAARRLALHDHRTQPFRRRIDTSSQAGWASADDAQVVKRLLRTGVQPESCGEAECRRRAKRLAVRDEYEWQVAGAALARLRNRSASASPLDVVPAVRHVVACQEHLDLMGAVGPAVADHANVGRVIGIGLMPVIEQVVNDRIQPFLGRIPGLEQVIVQPDVVDCLDRDIGVRVRRKEQHFRSRRVGMRLLEHLDARHLRHPLVGRDQRQRSSRSASLVRTSSASRPEDVRMMR